MTDGLNPLRRNDFGDPDSVAAQGNPASQAQASPEPGALRLSYEETGSEVTVTLVVPVAADADRAEEVAIALASAAAAVRGLGLTGSHG